MGYPIHLFIDDPNSIDEEYICCFCHQVFQDPTMSENCEHIYCNSCITELMDKAEASSSTDPVLCPIDNEPIEEVGPPIRAFMNLYNSLCIKCTYVGCDTVTCLGEHQAHINSCLHNPEGVRPCASGCGAAIVNNQITAHNCIVYLKQELKSKESLIKDAKGQIKGLVKEKTKVSSELTKQIQDQDSSLAWRQRRSGEVLKTQRCKEQELEEAIKAKDGEIRKISKQIENCGKKKRKRKGCCGSCGCSGGGKSKKRKKHESDDDEDGSDSDDDDKSNNSTTTEDTGSDSE